MDVNLNHALIIAAGRGVRFGNATRLCPKPLIEVAAPLASGHCRLAVDFHP